MLDQKALTISQCCIHTLYQQISIYLRIMGLFKDFPLLRMSFVHHDVRYGYQFYKDIK